MFNGLLVNLNFAGVKLSIKEKLQEFDGWDWLEQKKSLIKNDITQPKNLLILSFGFLTNGGKIAQLLLIYSEAVAAPCLPAKKQKDKHA